MIVFKAGLVLFLIAIVLFIIAMFLKPEHKLYAYFIIGFIYAMGIAVLLMFFGYIIGMISGAIPVIKVL